MPRSLLPLPKSVTWLDGAYTLPASASIAFEGPDAAQGVAELLAEYLRPATGYALPVIGQVPGHTCPGITLVQTADPAPDAAGFLPEAYTLSVDPAAGVRIEAPSAAGLARGIQTLRQLFPTEIYGTAKADVAWTLPAVQIDDEPAFRWRGLHLDVGRHFYGVDDVCRYIELLAQHRMSTFHWHLTEDQGWRIEIKKYPRLTEVGSIRKQTLIGSCHKAPRLYDHTPYGGFYTQDEVRRVVAFAARRHITVIPEIDMPGHMVAAIAAYPELGCGFNTHIGVRCLWGISDEVINMEDSTVQFCKDVWTELFDLFPSRIFHLGGDECPRREWMESEKVQLLLAQRGLPGEDELQAWFTHEMNDFFQAHGRRLIGWDEILKGGELDGSAIVMSWRGMDGGIAAAKSGHDVVMAPGSHTYFDHYQLEPQSEEPLAIGGLTTLAHTYTFNPVPPQLNADEAKHVLGGQGQLWTEYIADRDYLDYMAYPRACALAEVLWTPKAKQNFACFSARLADHRARLDLQGVKACPKP